MDINDNQTVITPANQTPQGFQTPPVANTTKLQGVTQSMGADHSKIGKKVFLVFASLLGLAVVAFLGLFVILTPTVKGLSLCMEESSIAMDALFQRGIEEKWTNQQKCQEFKPETERLIACFDNVGRSSLLPVQIAFSLGGLLRGEKINVNKAGLIQLHNTNCSQFPDTLITN